MAYKLQKTGDQVKEDLDKVEEKRVYPEADTHTNGIMTKEHVKRIGDLEVEVDESNETLSEFEIRMICR